MKSKIVLVILWMCALMIGVYYIRGAYKFLFFMKIEESDDEVVPKSAETVSTNMQITDIKDCADYLQNGLDRIVDDTFISTLRRICYNTSYHWNGESFDTHFLDHSMNNLECPESATFLKARRPLVALASFPGSGNSWTRQLIEIVTDIYTGSVYMEYQAGSKVCPASGLVFIVKTHLTNNEILHPECEKIHENILNYTKVIYILRNPFDTILSEFNRQTADSMNVASNEQFSSTNWRNKVRSLSAEWKSMTEYWLTKSKLPTHIIVYERQLSQTVLEMYQVMKFLDLPVKAKSLLCLSKLTARRRKKPNWLKPTNLYDAELRSVVNNAVSEVTESIGMKTRIGKIVKDYLLM